MAFSQFAGGGEQRTAAVGVFRTADTEGRARMRANMAGSVIVPSLRVRQSYRHLKAAYTFSTGQNMSGTAAFSGSQMKHG
jgi:hypothetical protein